MAYPRPKCKECGKPMNFYSRGLYTPEGKSKRVVYEILWLCPDIMHGILLTEYNIRVEQIDAWDDWFFERRCSDDSADKY